MAKNDRKIEEIDEAAMLQSIYERDNGISSSPIKPQAQTVASPETERQAEIPEKPKEENRPKKVKQQDYETLFIRESNITARLGKTVYIRKEFHDRIQKIVQVIGGNEISLFSYIDNIIAQHFEVFQDEIVRLYNQKNSSNIF